jgi:hypothetical protein
MDPQGEVCIANIGPRARRIRLGFGLLMSAVTALWFLGSVFLPLPRVFSLGIFIPAWMAATGILQHTGRT